MRCRFCGGVDGDGHLFWGCIFPPLVEIRENPEFHGLMEMDKPHWPRCFLWHRCVGCSLSGRCRLGLMRRGSLKSGLMGAWFRKRSRVLVLWGLCFFTHLPGQFWAGRRCGHLDDDVGMGRANRSCRGYHSVPGPLQSVQRAEFWSIILALQAADAVHFGSDNLGVVRHVGRLSDGNVGSCPAELVKDGDLILLIDRILEMRGRETVRVTEVKGHADEGMVRDGGVRELDRLGNNAGDEAADFGRRRVDFPVVDARRNFAGGDIWWFWSCIAF